MTFTQGRKWVLAKRETTYNTDPTATNPTDLKYVEAFDLTPLDTMIQRTGPSPCRPGFPPVVGPYSGQWSATVEVAPLAISGSGNIPECDVWLGACGFADPVYAAGTPGSVPFTQTYGLADAGHDSVWLEDYDADDANAEGWATVGGGARADWTLRISGPERWLLDLTGDTASGSVTATGAGKDSNTDFSGKIPAPAVGGGNYVEFVDLAGGLNYGDATAYVHEASFSGNMELQAKDAVNGREVILAPTAPVSASMTIEQTIDSLFDPWSLLGAATAVLVRVASSDLTFTQYSTTDANPKISGIPTVTGNYVMVETTMYVSSIARADAAGRKVWNIELMGGYPEAGSDEGGLVPAQQFDTIFGTYASA